MLWKTGALKGLRVLAKNTDAGKVEQFLFDDQKWAIRYIVIDVREDRKDLRKLLSPLAVQTLSSGSLEVGVSAEQLENSPGIDTAMPVSRQMEEVLHAYYSWPCYWLYPEGYNLLGGALYPGLSVPFTYPGAGWGDECVEIQPTESHLENTPSSSHLRLTNEVIGYRAIAADNEIGQVTEILIDDKLWYLKYLVVDTGHLLPGRKVLIPFLLVTGIEWTSGSIMMNVNKRTILESPVYNQEYPVTSEYESRIYGYYFPENRM
jgi:hypothetical protein